MNRKRIAIACQGGGSQCAFIAGALKTLFARGRSAAVRDRRAAAEPRAAPSPPRSRGSGCSSRRRATDAHPGSDHRVLERSDRPDAAGDRLRHDVRADAAARRARRVAELRDQPLVAAVPVHGEATSQLIARPEFTDLRALDRQARRLRRVAVAGRAQQPGASDRSGRRARGHLQGLQLRHGEIKRRGAAGVGRDPESVSGGVGRRPRLLGRHLLFEPAGRWASCASRSWASTRCPRRSGSSR